MSRGLPALFAALTWLSPAAAGGQEETERSPEELAKEFAQEGVALFADDRWDEAVEIFREAEKILQEAGLPVPPLVFLAIARCYDQLGQISAATAYYTRFLSAADENDERMEDGIRRAVEAKKRLYSQLDNTALRFAVEPDGVQVRIDRRAVGTTPLEPVKVTPGPHQVTFWAKGYEPASVDVDVAAGAMVPVVVSLVPRAGRAGTTRPVVPSLGQPAPYGPPRRGRTLLHWGVGGAAVAVAAGTAAALLLWPREVLPDRHAVRLTVRSR